MVVCYYTNWSRYRPGIGKYTAENIDASKCTHIVYGFAVLDYSNLVIKPHDSWADIDLGESLQKHIKIIFKKFEILIKSLFFF